MKTINVLIFSISLLFSGCSTEDENHLSRLSPYNLDLPVHFPYPLVPKDNPLTKEGVELGRKLYYEPMLSKEGDRSCSSCHDQRFGFTVPGTTILPHVNLAWSKNFLWNGKVQGSLEDVMMFEVKDFFESDPQRFNNSDQYRQQFKKVYDVDSITHKDLAFALAQFFRTMVSVDAPFDQNMEGEYQFTPSEYNGMTIFFSEKGDCFHCHGTALFTDNEFHNVGLEANPEGEHAGYAEVSGNAADKGKFKTPTLRNVSLRKSYMHDGRFKTLEEVVEHYDNGLKPSPTLDPIFYKNREDLKLGLTEKEKADLVSFLKTLTDQEFLYNPKLGNPFESN